MTFFTTFALGTMLAIAPLAAHAHITMTYPVPFGTPGKPPLSSANFPCQNIPTTGGTVNNWPVGSTQNLTLYGTAVHSGGSCQMSVTQDKTPTKASKWKVIHSWQGACPVPPPEGGNFPDSASPQRPPFMFPIPSELPNGDFVASWTWQNKVGNREVYQNCAPVHVTGGASNDTAFNALPDMAVANIAGVTDCSTKENFDYVYQNPGKYVTNGGTGPFMPLCGGPSTPTIPGGSAGGAAPAPGAPANSSAPSAAPGGNGASTQAQGMPSPVASANPGMPSAAPGGSGASTKAPGNSIAPAPSAASSPQASTLRTIITVTAPSGPPPAGATPPPVPIASSQAAAAPPAPAPASPSQGSAAPAVPLPAGQACSPDGAIVCSPDGKQFALCNHGKAVFQAVAAGTTCSGGQIARRQEASTLRTVYA